MFHRYIGYLATNPLNGARGLFTAVIKVGLIPGIQKEYMMVLYMGMGQNTSPSLIAADDLPSGVLKRGNGQYHTIPHLGR